MLPQSGLGSFPTPRTAAKQRWTSARHHMPCAVLKRAVRKREANTCVEQRKIIEGAKTIGIVGMRWQQGLISEVSC